MNRHLPLLTTLVAGLLLLAATPLFAGVLVQCPTRAVAYDDPDVALYPVNYEGWFADDVVVDGMLRASDGEIGNGIDVFPVSPNEVCLHLAAGDGFTNMADGREQYIFGFNNATDGTSTTNPRDDSVMLNYMLGATFPAPTMTFRQGDEVYLSLTNVGMVMRPDLFDPHTVHWHGFPNASSVFDGVPDASISINMGSTLTYYYKVVEPGTYMYHCHVEAAEHMQMGMLGNLYVTAGQDQTAPGNTVAGGSYVMQAGDHFAYNDGDGSTRYDLAYPIQISSFDPIFHEQHIGIQPLPFANMDDKYPMLNGRGYPDTAISGPLDPGLHTHIDGSPMSSRIEGTIGDRILLRISSLSTTSYHTLTVQGIPMLVVGQGSRKLGPINDTSQYYLTNSVTLGGGESIDVILDTAAIPAGTYFLYSTNLDHLANDAEDYGGMMTEIHLAN